MPKCCSWVPLYTTWTLPLNRTEIDTEPGFVSLCLWFFFFNLSFQIPQSLDCVHCALLLCLHRVPQSTEWLPALWGEGARSYILELGSSGHLTRPEPGGLRHTLLAVSGVQVATPIPPQDKASYSRIYSVYDFDMKISLITCRAFNYETRPTITCKHLPWVGDGDNAEVKRNVNCDLYEKKGKITLCDGVMCPEMIYVQQGWVLNFDTLWYWPNCFNTTE